MSENFTDLCKLVLLHWEYCLIIFCHTRSFIPFISFLSFLNCNDLLPYIIWRKFRNYIRAQSACSVVLILWTKSKKDLILCSSNLIAYQPRQTFFLNTTVWTLKASITHGTIWQFENKWLFVTKVMQYVIP